MALSDMEVAGRQVSAGQSVTLVLGSGNRDPRKFADPDRLDVTRRASDHLSFGHGIHYCLGAALAITEIEIAIRKLLERTADWQLVEPEPTWLDSINFRFMKAFPIRFRPQA
jgi:cytochrome P450